MSCFITEDIFGIANDFRNAKAAYDDLDVKAKDLDNRIKAAKNPELKKQLLDKYTNLGKSKGKEILKHGLKGTAKVAIPVGAVAYGVHKYKKKKKEEDD